MKRIWLSTIVAVVMGAASAQAALVNSYDFDSGLGGTLLSANDMTANGGTIGGGLYSFGANQGLSLADALADTATYGIELRLRFDSVGGYRKLIDFDGLTTDTGLYVYAGMINFYNLGNYEGAVTAGDFFTVGLERAGGMLTAFLNGTELFSVADTGVGVSAANVLSFFVDDFATGQGEASAGAVDFIRFHDDRTTFSNYVPTVPVPASLPLLAAGFGLLGLFRRKAADGRA